ncbi:uncharacterized protein LOC144250610 [Urocitellus parryii]
MGPRFQPITPQGTLYLDRNKGKATSPWSAPSDTGDSVPPTLLLDGKPGQCATLGRNDNVRQPKRPPPPRRSAAARREGPRRGPPGRCHPTTSSRRPAPPGPRSRPATSDPSAAGPRGAGDRRPRRGRGPGRCLPRPLRWGLRGPGRVAEEGSRRGGDATEDKGAEKSKARLLGTPLRCRSATNAAAAAASGFMAKTPAPLPLPPPPPPREEVPVTRRLTPGEPVSCSTMMSSHHEARSHLLNLLWTGASKNLSSPASRAAGMTGVCHRTQPH